jgi:hypothetical protein
MCNTRQYQTIAPGPLNDRSCATCTVCPVGFSAAPNTCVGSSNTECVKCSVCNAFQYQVASCQSFTNTACQLASVCPLNYAERVPPTVTSDRVCYQLPSSPNDAPPPDTLYVLVSAKLSGVPDAFNGDGSVSTDFLTVLTSAVRQSVQQAAGGYVGVTVFSVVSSGSRRRAAGDVTVSYRIEAPLKNVANPTTLAAVAGDNSVLTNQMRTVADTISTSDYSGSGAAVTGSPVIKGDPASSSSSSPSSSNSNTNLIIGVVVGVAGGVILISAIIYYVARVPTKGDADLNSNLALSDASILGLLVNYRLSCIIFNHGRLSARSNISRFYFRDTVEMNEVLVNTSGVQRGRQAAFYSSVRIADHEDESTT